MIPIPSPGMEPPRPSGCPSCAAAEAQCDRMAQRIRELEAALALEARARKVAADGLADAKDEITELRGLIRALHSVIFSARMVLAYHEKEPWTCKMDETTSLAKDGCSQALTLAERWMVEPEPEHLDDDPEPHSGFHEGHDTFEEAEGLR